MNKGRKWNKSKGKRSARPTMYQTNTDGRLGLKTVDDEPGALIRDSYVADEQEAGGDKK